MPDRAQRRPRDAPAERCGHFRRNERRPAAEEQTNKQTNKQINKHQCTPARLPLLHRAVRRHFDGDAVRVVDDARAQQLLHVACL